MDGATHHLHARGRLSALVAFFLLSREVEEIFISGAFMFVSILLNRFRLIRLVIVIYLLEIILWLLAIVIYPLRSKQHFSH